MNLKFYKKMTYENKYNWSLGENKPNSNPIKPNFRKAKMNINSFITKGYRKNDDFASQKTNPIQTQFLQRPKMNINLFTTKDYENETAFRPPKNKPKQTQSNPMVFQIPSINSKDRLVICSSEYSLDGPFFAGKQADVIIFPENRQYSFTAFFARNP